MRLWWDARKRTGWLSGLATTAIVFGFALNAPLVSAQMIYVQLPEPGDFYVNSCRQLPLHDEPSALTDVVGMADIGDEFEVVGLAGRFLVPESLRASTTHDFADDRGDDPFDKELVEEDFTYAWIEVVHDGGTAFAATRCMVSPEFFEQQNPEDALRKFESARVGQTGKGVSITPVKKGSGKELGGDLAAAHPDRQAAERLASIAVENPYDEFKDFRKAGGLLEFNPNPVDERFFRNPAREADDPAPGS